MIGSLDHRTRQLIVHTSPTKRSSDFIAHLEQLDRLYGSPNPDERHEAGRAGRQRTMDRSVSASSPLPPSKRASIGSPVEWPPKYAPELNDIEVVWHDLKAHNLAHYTFTDAADLDRAIHQAVQALNNGAISQSVGQLENLCLEARPAYLSTCDIRSRDLQQQLY